MGKLAAGDQVRRHHVLSEIRRPQLKSYYQSNGCTRGVGYSGKCCDLKVGGGWRVCRHASDCTVFLPEKQVLPLVFGYSFEKPEGWDVRRSEAYFKACKIVEYKKTAGRTAHALWHAGIYTVDQLKTMDDRWWKLFSICPGVGRVIVDVAKELAGKDD